MRRQTATGGPASAGSSRHERLDPFTLPVRFAAKDISADGRVRLVELSRDHVVLRRAVRGIKMAVRLPIATYLGVAIRIEPPADGDDGAIVIMLEHRDPALSLPLCRSTDSLDMLAEWQSWARVLKLPLLVAESDGHLREPFERIGAVRVATPARRRRRRTTIRARRPTLPLRRRPGRTLTGAVVHRGEREIIARN